MDDDEGGARVARAGRRAARKVENWGEEQQETSGFGQSGGGTSDPVGNDFDGPGDQGDSEGPSRQQTQDDDRPSPSGGGDTSGGGAPRAPPLPANSWQSNADPLSGESSKRFAGISRRKAEQLSRGDEEVVRKNQRYEDVSGKAAEAILDIPELEDEGREDLSNVVAAAPKVRTNKVQGMSELDEDMHFKLPSTDDRDIDLSLLTAVLCASEQVQEGDELWDPEILLTEVASAVNQEREKAEGADAEPKDADGANDQKAL